MADFEIVFFELARQPGRVNRLVVHALLGASVLCSGLVVLLRWAVYASLMKGLLRAKISDRSVGLQLLSSGIRGAVSHILLDLAGHPYNAFL